MTKSTVLLELQKKIEFWLFYGKYEVLYVNYQYLYKENISFGLSSI